MSNVLQSIESEMFMHLIIQSLLSLQLSGNLIQNGDFSSLIPEDEPSQCPTNWTCSLTTYMPTNQNGITYHYAGMGAISQHITIPKDGVYILYIQLRFIQEEILIESLGIYFNNEFLDFAEIHGTNCIDKIQLNQKINLFQGEGELKLQLITTVILKTSLQFSTNLTIQETKTLSEFLYELLQPFGMALVAPLSSIMMFHGYFLLLGDCWLFVYSIDKFYKGILKKLLDTIKVMAVITIIEINFKLPMSNYTNYTEPKFVEVQKSSSVFLETTQNSLIFEIPKTVAVCVLLFGAFKLTGKRVKFREKLRQYYFLKEMIFFSLLEQNISYYAFVCSGHLEMAFFFKFADKLFFLFTIFMGFCVVLFVIIFYYFLGRHKLNWTKDFNNKFVRNFRGHTTLTISGTCRYFLKSLIFFYLKRHYVPQMMLLGSLEIAIGFIVIAANSMKAKSVFEAKIWFCLSISYNMLFAALHFILAFDDVLMEDSLVFPEIGQFFETIENIVLCFIGGIVVMRTIFSFLPQAWLSKNVQPKQPKTSKKKNNHKSQENLEENPYKQNDQNKEMNNKTNDTKQQQKQEEEILENFNKNSLNPKTVKPKKIFEFEDVSNKVMVGVQILKKKKQIQMNKQQEARDQDQIKTKKNTKIKRALY